MKGIGFPDDMKEARSITEWIGVFQWEEYGSRGADTRQGRAMAHFNDFLARHGELPSKVTKRSRLVTAPIKELKPWHLERFLTWVLPQVALEDIEKQWYTPTLAKFIQWLGDNKAITDVESQALLAALTKTDGESQIFH